MMLKKTTEDKLRKPVSQFNYEAEFVKETKQEGQEVVEQTACRDWF